MIIESKNNKFSVSHYKSIIMQAKGLMFKFPKNEGILFEFKKEKYIALHTFFVFFPIDIIYINKNKEIIKIFKKVIPFTPFIKPIKCKYILEVKNAKNLKLKEKIKFKDL